MKEGQRPRECDFCWKVEDAPGGQFSDRILKSHAFWSQPRLDEISKMNPDQDVNPSYVEVSFGNECNFKCSYCNPSVSSSIWKSYEKHGPLIGADSLDYYIAKGLAPAAKGESNPYVDAFWKWFPELSKELVEFRLTGGEPLVNSNTYRVMEYLKENHRPNLRFNVNSNLGVPERFFRKFLDSIKDFKAGQEIGDFVLFTSIDTHGPQAEYIRLGLDYELWKSRLVTYLNELPYPISLMVTFNALSVPSFIDLLKDILEINKGFLVTEDSGWLHKRIFVDITHLQHPQHLSALILDDFWIGKISEILQFMESHSEDRVGAHGFSQEEIIKMRRINSWVKSSAWPEPERVIQRRRFAIFLNQIYEREGLVFDRIFPEMKTFADQCRALGPGHEVIKSEGKKWLRIAKLQLHKMVGDLRSRINKL